MDEFVNLLKKYDKSEICVITDFDDTLTKGILDKGRRASNSFSVYQNHTELLEENFVERSNELFCHYYEIEQNSNINDEEKTKAMVEWWTKEFALYINHGLSEEILNKIIRERLIELREGVQEFLEITYKNNIPVVIFSAGIYNLIHEFLKFIESDFDNNHVVANIMEFDENGTFTKTKGDVIHSMNKNFEELSHLPVYSDLENKKACILLGDSVSDLKMTENGNFEYVLKIGFLNKLPDDKNYEESLKAHKENYDLVLDGREDFSKINEILRNIVE